MARSGLGQSFFLTGGTALAACYLRHRLSEDLDFFTEEPGAVRQVAPVLETIAREAAGSVRIARQFETFLGAFITSPQGETVKIDFAQDSPFRLRPLESSPYEIRVDNPLDIACNKLSALFERAAAKDFVDLYFIDQKLVPFEELLPQAQRKHVGLDRYWLAIAFQQVERIDKWPVMKAACDFKALRAFFLAKARELLTP
ncbi:MAG: hypothetical protein A2992_03225 [Elusimicrobia bacterium RIFCSPLOWO2_01_FULL_59_12]|nr:MAG: hypothetical protein A2992_03225 [Elusimicrobia bacterium RIFCSPLOWO2_01_FULL_59_12]